MGAHVAWDKGGEARVVSVSDDAITLLSTTPAPPGARPEGRLESGERLRLKIHRCVRGDDGFRLEGRLLDAPRALREHLVALAGREP